MSMLLPKHHLLTPRTIFANLPAPAQIDNPPPLLSLPVELLLAIYDFLEPDGQALLTLTCKTILHRLGCKSWEHQVLTARWRGDAYHTRWDAPRSIPAWLLTPDTLIRVPFLQALARDVPTLSYCNPCRVLHPHLQGPAAIIIKKGKNPSCLVGNGIADWWMSDSKQGYTLLWDHIAKAMTAHALWLKDPEAVPDYELLAAKQTFQHITWTNPVKQTITYSAHSIGRNLLLKHSHVFSSATSPLSVDQVLQSNVSICPHLLATSVRPSVRDPKYLSFNYWLRRGNAGKHSPLLPYAINTAFPASEQLPKKQLESRFREPYAREESQMFGKRKPGEYWWCRGCATKFRVQYDDGEGTLKIDVYHNFGASSVAAMAYFNHLVHRMQNDELRCLSRTFAAFECEDEEK